MTHLQPNTYYYYSFGTTDETTGIFNANGPNAPTNMAELLYGCKAVTGGDARFTWVNADFLTERLN